jgi:hypothetical protein
MAHAASTAILAFTLQPRSISPYFYFISHTKRHYSLYISDISTYSMSVPNRHRSLHILGQVSIRTQQNKGTSHTWPAPPGNSCRRWTQSATRHPHVKTSMLRAAPPVSASASYPTATHWPAAAATRRRRPPRPSLRAEACPGAPQPAAARPDDPESACCPRRG